jgi:hypothetical protein
MSEPEPLPKIPLKYKEKEKAWKGELSVSNDEAGEGLTFMQMKFAELYATNGGNGSQAARDAGYAESNCKQEAHGLLKKHKIREAIELHRDTSIKTAGASKAWAVIDAMMTDPSAPAQVRFQAAKWTLEASGHGLSAIAASLHLGMKKSNKSLSEMSISELEEFINRGRQTFDYMKSTVKTVVNAHEQLIVDVDKPKT